MAEKEFLLGNRARELLKYTKQATRIVSDDVSQRDVRAIIRRIAELDDIRDVKKVCSEVVGVLDKKDREGFTKSTFRLYGEDMRQIARGIMRDIHAANNKHFVTEYNERLRKIDDALDGCSLLLEYIRICVEEKIIGVKKAAVWTKHVTDVKYMSAAWKKNDGGRARKIESEVKASEERRQYDLVKAACREVINSRK
ncbi:four helix bundle protein [Flintibacter porci]|uniref:four helix bundle protein n=1 Tax=Flintibacter porci TaxID=3342383 RepID=UPI003F8C3CDE